MSHKKIKNLFSYNGGCHCQKVRFELTLENPLEETKVILCNCSMCDKYGFLHLIVPKEQVQLNMNSDQLTNYQFNTKTAKHYFCKNCGVKSFYQPRSHPKSWSINARCLDDYPNKKLSIEYFDGQNWEDNISSIT